MRGDGKNLQYGKHHQTALPLKQLVVDGIVAGIKPLCEKAELLQIISCYGQQW